VKITFKHRIAPAYYMQIYQTPIRQIPIQLNELWKHAALPTKHAHRYSKRPL